jgi:hypothetical protein
MPFTATVPAIEPGIGPEKECPVSRLIMAVVVGIVIAIGAVALVENVLAGDANGTPTNASIYQYGAR